MGKTSRNLILIILATCVLMLTLLIEYNLNQKKQMEIIKLDKNTELTESKKPILYGIESVNLSAALCTIKGWAIINEVNSYNVMPNVILRDEQGNLYKLKTRITQRADITKLLNGSDADSNTHLTSTTKRNLGVTKNKNIYNNCGIISEFKVDSLDKKKKYQIGIELQNGEKKYFTWTIKEIKF